MPQTSWLHALLFGAHRNLYLYAMESRRVKVRPSILSYDYLIACDLILARMRTRLFTDQCHPFKVQLPMDMFYTMLTCLEPSDLLQWARVSRTYHRILTSKTSAKYWTAARQNVPGLPDCPRDMSEIRYAFLVFGKYCESCGCSSEEANHSLRIRLCSVCSQKRVLPANTLRCRCGDPDSNTASLVVKAGLIPSAWNVHYLSYRQDTSMFHRLIPFLMLIRYNNALECDEVEYKLVLQKCRALRANARALEEYVEERKAVIIERYRHAFDVIVWEAAQRKN